MAVEMRSREPSLVNSMLRNQISQWGELLHPQNGVGGSNFLFRVRLLLSGVLIFEGVVCEYLLKIVELDFFKIE